MNVFFVHNKETGTCKARAAPELCAADARSEQTTLAKINDHCGRRRLRGHRRVHSEVRD